MRRRFEPEWTLHLDRAGRILRVSREKADGDSCLAELVENWETGALFAALDPSLSRVVEAAERYGVSGLRIASLPYSPSQGPVLVSVEAAIDVRGWSRVSMTRLAPTSRDPLRLVSATQSELIALAASLATRAVGTVKEAADFLAPLLLDACRAQGGFVLGADGTGERLELIGAYGCHRGKVQKIVALEAFNRPPYTTSWGQVLQGSAEDLYPAVHRSGQRKGIHYAAADAPDGLLQYLLWVTCDRDPGAGGMVDAQYVASLLGLEMAAAVSRATANRRLRDLTTAYATTKAISASLDIERKFHEIAASAAAAMGGASCLVLESDAKTGCLLPVAFSDESFEMPVGLTFRFDMFQDAEGMMPESTAISIDDLRADYGIGPLLRRVLTMRSAALVPITAKGVPIGALLLFSRTADRGFAREELRMVEHVADQAASAIENARLYRDLRVSESRSRSLLQQVALVREQERSSVARVVHDGIAQSMVGAVYALESISKRLLDPERLEVQRTVADLRDASERSRELIHRLRHPALDELGLPSALRSEALKFQQRTGTKCKVECSGSGSLPRAHELCLYQIAREALANARRHSGAESVSLELDYEPDSVILLVADDGCGISSARFDGDRRHFGLEMIQELAASLDGECSIGGGERGGTMIRVRLPISMAGSSTAAAPD